MRYVSTRGLAPALNFEDTFLAALARDGGLYVPEHWPKFEDKAWASSVGLAYPELAKQVMAPFIDGEIPAEAFGAIVDQAYASFRHAAVAPLVQIGPALWVMELFHGPTLAFKDVAMQVIGGLFDHVLSKRNQRVTIIGATSGDTGSAAIEAIRGREQADIFILHPHGRTSEVQRRQMTTVHEANVHNIAIEGTFDDCQNLVKAMFNDQPFRDSVSMSGVNSINWGRVMPQAVYYAAAALSLGAPERGVRFSVPTGNFGDIFAGYVAKQMGLPIEELVIATNRNDILCRAMNAGDHSLGSVHHTMSPSMDIQVSSNFERMLFEMYGRDAEEVRVCMDALKRDKQFSVAEPALAKAREVFTAYRCDEQQTLETIGRVHRENAYLLDPHTAVGVHAAEQAMAVSGDRSTPMIVLATAHPAKFPDAVEKATGVRPPLPAFLADLYDREERFEVLPNDLATVQAHVKGKVDG